MRSSLVIAAAALAAAFSSNLSAQGTPAAQGSCAIQAAAGSSEQRLTSGGRERTYLLFVPKSYDGRTPLPLVLELHGSGGTAQRQAAHPEFRETLLQAAALAEQVDDTAVLVQAALGFSQGDAMAADDDTKRVASAALDRIGTDPTPTRARLLAVLASAHDATADWSARRDLSLEAIGVARDSDDAATFVQTIDGEEAFVRRDSMQIKGEGLIGLGKVPDSSSPQSIRFVCEEP